MYKKRELQFAIAHVVKKYRKKSITKSADEIGMENHFGLT